MDENNKLQFEQFTSEKEAEDFTKRIEVKLEKKFGQRFYNEKAIEEKMDRIVRAKKEKGGKKVEKDSEDGVEEKEERDSDDSKNEEIKKKNNQKVNRSASRL